MFFDKKVLEGIKNMSEKDKIKVSEKAIKKIPARVLCRLYCSHCSVEQLNDLFRSWLDLHDLESKRKLILCLKILNKKGMVEVFDPVLLSEVVKFTGGY